MRGKDGREWLTPDQIDQNKSQGIIDTGIDWENKKMKNDLNLDVEEPVGISNEEINRLALGTDEINFLKKAAPEEEIIKDYQRMKLKKSESPDQMEFDYDSKNYLNVDQDEPATRRKKFSQRRSKHSSRSPKFSRSPEGRSPSKRSGKSTRFSKKSGSPSMKSDRTMSRRSPKNSERSEFVEGSIGGESRAERFSKKSKGVKFAEPEKKSISTFDQMFMEIKRIQKKPKRSLTRDEKSILRKWQQINK